jgi:hypothetical protein
VQRRRKIAEKYTFSSGGSWPSSGVSSYANTVNSIEYHFHFGIIIYKITLVDINTKVEIIFNRVNSFGIRRNI